MPRDKRLPPQLYLFEHNMPSCKLTTQVERTNHVHESGRLTYSERVAQGNAARHGARSEPARASGTVVCTGPNASSVSKQSPSRLERSSTVRRQKAYDDLRMNAYASKPLPALPPQTVTEPPASAAAQEKQYCVKSQRDQRRPSMIDEAVRSVRDVAKRCKSKYARQRKKIRLSLAWEVEEIV